MRKWTYLVAALLMGGVTTSLTSCIDNDEPAGINELRGAKAAFIKAKADYEAALTQIKLVDVEIQKQVLAREEIATKMEQLKYEIQQAKDELTKHELTLQKDLLTEQYKEKLIWAKEATAKAQKALVEALNSLEIAELEDRDHKFFNIINQQRIVLNQQISLLVGAQNELYIAQVSLVNYESENKFFKEGLELQKVAHEKDLAILQGLLKNYKETSSADMAELNKKLAEIESQQIQLVEKDKKAWQELQTLKSSSEFVDVDNKVQEILIALHKDSSFSLDSKQFDESIQEKLYTVLTNLYTGKTDIIDGFFNEDHKLLTENVIVDKKLTTSTSGKDLKYEDLASKLEELANELLKSGKTEYVNEYNILLSASVTLGSVFDDENAVKASYANNVEAEKKRLEADKDVIKGKFETSLNAWVKSYADYLKALKAYGGYEEVKPYNDMLARINEVVKIYDEDPTKVKKETAQAWRNEIYDYLSKRALVDDASIEALAEDFYDNWGIGADKKDKITDTNINDFVDELRSATSIIGSNPSIATSVTYQADYEGVSLLQKFLNANADLFDNPSVGSSLQLKAAIIPKLTEGAAPENIMDAIPANMKEDVDKGLYKDYLASIDFDATYPDLANYAKWKAAYDYIMKEQVVIADAVSAMNDEKEKLVNQFNDLYQKVWTAEVNGYLILGGKTVDGYSPNSWISKDNPYHEFLGQTSIEGGAGVPLENRSEYAKLEQQRLIYQAAVDGGKLSYVTYVEQSEGQYVYATTEGDKALETLIEETEQEIVEVQESIEDVVNDIALFEEVGYDGSRFKQDLENNIAAKQRKVDEYQANVDFINATLKKYLDAYANGSTDVPEIPEGGEGSASETPAE